MFIKIGPKFYCFCFIWGHQLVGQFACLHDPLSSVRWSLVLLVGPPMTKRSKGRDQTKSHPVVLQVGGWV